MHTPWEHQTALGYNKRPYHVVVDCDGNMVCECYEGTDSQRAAYVAFIVKAVNCHDDLVKALEWFVADERFQVGVGGNPIVVAQMIEDAKSILARAK